MAFINARALDDMRTIVDANPPLLTAVGDPVFDALLQQYEANEDAVRMITFKRHVLNACREAGVDEVFADWAQQLAAGEAEPEQPHG